MLIKDKIVIVTGASGGIDELIVSGDADISV